MPGSLPSKPLLIVGVVSVALVFAYWLTGRFFLAPHDRPVDVLTSAPTSVSPVGPIATSTAKIIAQRDKLDREVWSDELLAEQYETPIVQLWDTLRAAGDKLQVLAEFPLRSIVVGQWMSTSQLDYGIEVSQLASSDKTMTGVEWLDFIQRYKSQGYRLVQSEWHHARFEQSRKGACPRSTVGVSLHVTNSQTEERVVIKGDLAIDWLPRSDDAGPRVDHIDASRLTVYRCAGKPAFRLAATLPSRLQTTTDFMAAYDLNKDGLSEIIFGNRIFWNGGDGQFAASPLSDHRTRPLNSAVLADFNGDGQVDLFTADPNLRPQLFLADDQGRFTSPPREVRVIAPLEGFSTSISAGDVDGDRDLDIWLTQYKRPYLKGQMPTPYYDANDGFASYLLINDGNGEFRDATAEAGLSPKRFRRTYSSSLVDLDDDLDLDLLVVSDFAGVDVYENDGLGRFQDVTSKWIDQPHNFGMSHTIDDFDGDGRLDFYVTGMGSTTARRLDFMNLSRPDMQQHAEMRTVMGYGNRLYLRRDDRFEEPPWSSEQLARTGWSWGSTSLDWDNDGDRDIYVGNGHISGVSARDYCSIFWRHDIYAGSSQPNAELESAFTQIQRDFQQQGSWNGFEHNCLLLNGTNRRFDEVGFLLGLAHEFDTRAILSDDIDADGRVDLLIIQRSVGRPAILHVMKNYTESDAHWIGIRLVDQPGRSPLGAKVAVYMQDGTKRIGTVVTGDSFNCQHAAAVHFGLGDQVKVDRIEVTWPDAMSHVIREPAVDRYHLVRATRE